MLYAEEEQKMGVPPARVYEAYPVEYCIPDSGPLSVSFSTKLKKEKRPCRLLLAREHAIIRTNLSRLALCLDCPRATRDTGA